MPHPVLPRMVPDAKKNKVLQFKGVGKWDRRSPEEVKNVADALDVPDRDIQLESVPDIWAVPLNFESALLGEAKNKRSMAVEAEWRGLLAILALRSRRSIQDVEFLPVFKGEPATKFLKVAKQLLPDHLNREKAWQRTSIDQLTSWTDISIITLKKQVIGITSPTTLVCTAPRRGVKALSGIAWFDAAAGRLRDPKPFLSPEETRALAFWIGHFQQHLDQINCSGAKYIRLSRVLTRFRESLVPEGVTLGDFSIASGVAVEGAALYPLGSPVAHREDGSSTCDVELKSFRLAPPAARALVISEDLPRQWHKSSTEVTVLSSTPLQAALNNLDREHRDVIHGMPIVNGHWYVPEDFFTPKLYAFTAGAGLPGAVSTSGQSQIRIRNASGEEKPTSLVLPIRKQWLEWLTAEELSKRISFSAQGVDVEVFLKLPLSGGELTIYHRYGKGSIIDLGTQLPVTRIWPFLRTPGWKAYYTYYDNSGDENIYLHPYVWNSQTNPKMIPVTLATPEQRAEVTRTRAYPEAMTATYKGEESGILLLQTPPAAVPTGQEWRVGIDFGTTGTTVFAASSQMGDGHALPFEPRLQAITVEPPTFQGSTYRRFLPALAEDGGSLLSIFHDFNVSKPDQANAIQPLTEGRICFIQNAESFRASEPGISTNMKWGNDQDRARGEAFLQQLTLQIAAEAAASGARSISWRFSFPTAFSDHELNAFGNIWEKIIARCEDDTGIRALTHNELRYKRKNESLATAHAFRKTEKAAPQQGAIFVDIGGGTTDIAIWQGSKQLSQSSFRFAGRDIFLHPIYLRPTFLKIFGDLSKLEDLRRADEYVFHSQVDVILRGKSSEGLLAQLPTLTNEQNPVVIEFLELLKLGIAGILHYIGLVLRDLETRGIYKRFMPNIYIGGNGSKILHWIGVGSYKPNIPADRILKTVFARATNFSDLGKSPFEIRTSKAPKSEVAQGLILDYDSKTEESQEEVDLFADDQTDPPLLAGEDYSKNGVLKSWNTFLEPQTDLSKVEVLPDLAQLRAFLQVLKISPDELAIRQCAGEINQTLADTAHTEQKDRHLEPLFVTALRALHRQRAENWAAWPLSPKEK